MDEIDTKLNQVFPGRVVRKDLTKKIKEGANVPVYVLEYLLGMYCATDDAAAIEDGIITVKKILAENFVRPDEAQKVKSKIRELKNYTVIDKITVKLNEKKDRYEAEFSNLLVLLDDVLDLYAETLTVCIRNGVKGFGSCHISPSRSFNRLCHRPTRVPILIRLRAVQINCAEKSAQ